jgi:hypothetical protein
MTKTFALATLCLILCSSGAAFAANPEKRSCKRPYPHTINQRQRNQMERIQQGIRSGELTQKETYRLLSAERKTNQLEHRFRADGTLTPYERFRLDSRLDAQNNGIYLQKHDSQDRN